METVRQRQVAETVKRHFSQVVHDEGPYIYGTEALVTVTNVKMTPDLNLAKIYLSIYNVDHKQVVLLEMNEEISRLKQSLAFRLRKQLRRIPEIALFLDDTLDEMYRVDAIFNDLYANNQMGSASGEEE